MSGYLVFLFLLTILFITFFALPGSTKAVELAMTKLILPELKHLLSELRKSPESA